MVVSGTIYEKEDSRPCVQFQGIDATTIQNSEPLPDIPYILKSYGKAKIFLVLDLLKSYNQIAVNDEDISKLTIMTPFGTINNEPLVFRKLIHLAMQSAFVPSHIGDIYCYSMNFSDDLNR